MIRSCLASALLLCMAFNVPAQSRKLVIHGVIGANFPGITKFNDELSRAGLAEAPTVYFTRGGGFYSVSPSTRIATLFYFASYTGTKDAGQSSTAVRSTQVGSSLGYALSRNAAFEVIPFAGLAYSFFGARPVRTDAGNDAPFGDFIGGEPNQYNLSHNNWAGHIGLHLARSGFGSGALGKNLVLGLRSGYYLPIGGTAWKSNKVSLSGGPSLNAGGYYVTFIFGFAQ